MKNSLSVIYCSLFLSFFSLSAHSAQEEEYQAYRDYIPLEKKIKSESKIVIFFSFASRESYDLIYEQWLFEYLKSFFRYRDFELVPVDFYSPYDKFLADKWCLEESLSDPRAMDYPREKYFKDVFFWMDRYQSTGLDTGETHRLQGVILKSGFSNHIHYHRPTSSLKNVIARCNMHRKEMIERFNVTSVPSVYVNGNYLINYDAMSARGRSQWDYIDLIDYLLDKND